MIDDAAPQAAAGVCGKLELTMLLKMARPKGFEPLTSAFGGQRSIQLSYGRQARGTVC